MTSLFRGMHKGIAEALDGLTFVFIVKDARVTHDQAGVR
jgi:hypothetical protein